MSHSLESGQACYLLITNDAGNFQEYVRNGNAASAYLVDHSHLNPELLHRCQMSLRLPCCEEVKRHGEVMCRQS